MGRSRNKKSGTTHTGRVSLHHHHHENKQDIAETRAIEAVRRGAVAVIDAPLPEIKPLLDSDTISQAIREVIGDGFEDTFQDVWVAVVEQGLNDVEGIKAVAKELNKKAGSKVIGERFRNTDIDKPLTAEPDSGTLLDIIPAKSDRGDAEIDADIEEDAPQYRGFGKQSRKGVVWLDEDTVNAIRKRFPHESLKVGIKHLLSIPVNEQTPYSLWEDAIIRERYTWGGSQAVMLSVNRSRESVNARANTLGVRMDGKQRPVKEWLDAPHLAAELGTTPFLARQLIRKHEIASVRIPKYYGNRDGVFVTPQAIADYRAGVKTPEIKFQERLAVAVRQAKDSVRSGMREKHRISLAKQRAMLAKNTVSRRVYKARISRNSRAELKATKEAIIKEIAELKATKEAQLDSIVQERRANAYAIKQQRIACYNQFAATLNEIVSEKKLVLAEYKQSHKLLQEDFRNKRKAEFNNFVRKYTARLAEFRQNQADRDTLLKWADSLREERALLTRLAESWQLQRWGEIRISVSELEAGKWLVVKANEQSHLCYLKDGRVSYACRPDQGFPAHVCLEHKYDPFTWSPPTCKKCLQILANDNKKAGECISPASRLTPSQQSPRGFSS